MSLDDVPEAPKQQRISFENLYMEFAWSVSKRSSCERMTVGCVITTTDFRKVLSIGYNGNASGLKNSCDSTEPGNCGCLHAEDNAIINCDSPRFMEKYVFITHMPCLACAKRLINLGNVKKIFYAQEYRVQISKTVLNEAGIPFERLPGWA